jgi:hypothetical protein
MTHDNGLDAESELVQPRELAAPDGRSGPHMASHVRLIDHRAAPELEAEETPNQL